MELKSTSEFIHKTLKQIQNGVIKSRSILPIEVAPSVNILDLFMLGRILAFCHMLLNDYQITSHFQFKKGPRLDRLSSLGFFDYCETHSILFSPKPSPRLQKELHFVSSAEKQISLTARPLTYWAPIHPLFAYPISSPSDEASALQQTQHITKIIADTLHRNLEFLMPTTGALGVELSRILFGIITELVSNSIRHSCQSSLVVAMTTYCEPNPRSHAHRSGDFGADSQAIYDILVMDFGKGITRTISDTLGASIAPFGQYFAPTLWSEEYHALKKKEEALLTGVFDGSLMVRKGRKSEGLYELSHNIGWFGGMLNFSSGRTEMHLGPGDRLSPRILGRKGKFQPYYLPGVVASAILPSNELAALRAKRKAELLPEMKIDPASNQRMNISQFKRLPSALLSGQVYGTARRRSELDAHILRSEDQHAAAAQDSQLPVWEVNLRLAATISIEYFDSLLQEMCKLSNLAPVISSSLLARTFFSNVPRHVITELKKRNCTAFLLTSKRFCLLLDESGHPHFLGAPRISKRVFDTEACLRLLYYFGHVSEATLKNEFQVSDAVLNQLKQTLTENDSNLFWTERHNDGVWYNGKNLVINLQENRLRSISQLNDVRVNSEDGTAVCRLLNGNYVDVVYDFNAFWSDTCRLWDAAHLLLALAPYRPVEHLISFVDNGDRLAGVLQRLTATPNLIVVDPQRRDDWASLDIEGACAIVLDALYPGDDDGYVGDFLRFAPSKNARIWMIYAVGDFRSKTAQQDSDQRQSVVSVPLPSEFRRPMVTEPRAGVRVLGSPWRQGKVGFTATLDDELLALKENFPTQYTSNEFSTEFWHNVSVLRLFDIRRSGREERDVLFYENTKMLIQHARMRRLVVDFVCSFVRNTLHSQADVIVYPSHSVGAFLSQLIADQLPLPPLQIQLAQPQYGGSIEITISDYSRFRELLEERKRMLRRDTLSSVIVDDSIFTGKSIFTMLGACAELDIRPAGILVLISRLTHEVSEAMRMLSIPIETLYRLHMPVLSAEHSPDRQLVILNAKFANSTSSYCGRWWAQKLAREKSHLLWPESLETSASKPPSVKAEVLHSIRGLYLAHHELKILLQELILHPHLDVINLSTRLAVVHNFMDTLVLEPDFWEMLKALYAPPPIADDHDLSLLFLQKCIFLLAFTPQVQVDPIHTSYEELCVSVLATAIASDTWLQSSELLAECIMSLGIIGSDHLVRASAPLLRRILPDVLAYRRDLSIQEQSANANYFISSYKQDVARNLVGAFAWSCAHLVERLGPKVLHADNVNLLTEAAAAMQGSVEGHLLLVDIFDPMLKCSSELRAILSIAGRREENEYLSALEQQQSPIVRYMREAPGYTCTLNTVLRICKAETILLYTKSVSEGEFKVLVSETKHNIRTSPALRAEHLGEFQLPIEVKQRMAAGLFICSNDPKHTVILDRFATGKQHQWCLGAPVHVTESELEYYVLLGYSDPPTMPFQATSYYYWLRCGDFLTKTLRDIHRRHIVSAAARNAVILSLTPLHSPHVNDSLPPAIAERRQILRLAIGNIEVGDLLRRAVSMSIESVYTFSQIFERISDVSSQLHRLVNTTISLLPEVKKNVFGNMQSHWPVKIKTQCLSQKEQEAICAVHMAVLEFVLYECLCNALSYCSESIQLESGLRQITPISGKLHDQILRVEVLNDMGREAKEWRNRKTNNNPLALSEQPTGLSACAAALHAIDGTFETRCDDISGLFKASIGVPLFLVPIELQKHLGDYLA